MFYSGGMGTIAPNPYYTDEIAKTCMETIFLPTMHAMNAEGRTFKGCLYFGLMLTENGPKVIEYNCRFGDPETLVDQSIAALVAFSLALVTAVVLFSVWTGMFFIRSIVRPIGEIEATAAKIAEGNLDTRIENKYNDEIGKLSDTINHMAGELDKTEVKFSDKSACCLVLASQGYPKKYETGYPITIPADLDAEVYVAGAKLDDGVLKTSGGRVLGVSAIGDTLKEAIDKAYREGAKVKFENAYCRKDIGAKALRAEEEVK